MTRGKCGAVLRLTHSRVILLSLFDDDAWRKRFSTKRDVVRRVAQEALDLDARGETRPLDDLL